VPRLSTAAQRGEEGYQPYLADVQKLDKFFHTKCGEPIRSGLDRRYSHVILLKDHVEWETWWRAVAISRCANLNRAPPGKSNRDFVLGPLLKEQVFCNLDFCVISGPVTNRTRRLAVGALANMYYLNLARIQPFGPLEAGFIDMAESAVFGSPSLTIKDINPAGPARDAGVDGQDWTLLVRQRMAAHQATPIGKLFNMDYTLAFSQPQYAEGWTLVELLNKQPAKFGKLLLELRDVHSWDRGFALAAIKKVYGWDAAELTKRWRAYVLGQEIKGAPKLGRPGAGPARDEQFAEDDAKPAEGDAPDAAQPRRILPAQAEVFKSPKGFSLTCPDGWRVASEEQMKQFAETLKKAGRPDATAAMIIGPVSNGFAAKLIVTVHPGKLVLDAKSEEAIVGVMQRGWGDAGKPPAIKTGHISIGGERAFTMEGERTEPTSGNVARQWMAMLPGKRQWYSITCTALALQWDDVWKGFREIVLSFKADLDNTGAKKVAGDDEKDTRLTLKEIQQLRGRPMPAAEVAETVAERGRAFEVTAEVAGQLRRLGFNAAQIDAVREASDEPLVPGNSLTTSDEQRDQVLEEMKQVTAKSKVNIEPIGSQHVTLWASKDVQQRYLADVNKVEKFFHTRCAEPIRSGLDKRSTHIILLKDHAEYEAWWRAMFALFGEQFDEKDNPGGKEEFQKEVLKGSAFYSTDFVVVSLAGGSSDQMHRSVVAGVAGMYAMQLARPQRGQRELGPLETGFINWAEAAVFGSPAVMFGAIVYHQDTRFPVNGGQAWSLLVRQRMAKNRATPLAELLTLDHSKMSEAHYAEAWTLVELLAGQRGKFGKLLLETRDGVSGLEAVEKVYGWDEKELAKQWRAHVMAARGAAGGQGEPKAATTAKATSPAAVADQFRTWQDASGNFTVQAEFVSATAGVAKLRRPDGSTINVPIEKLSDEDQKFIRNRGK
jgi:hypothetical protein